MIYQEKTLKIESEEMSRKLKLEEIKVSSMAFHPVCFQIKFTPKPKMNQIQMTRTEAKNFVFQRKLQGIRVSDSLRELQVNHGFVLKQTTAYEHVRCKKLEMDLENERKAKERIVFATTIMAVAVAVAVATLQDPSSSNANIRRIRNETDTRVDLPDSGSDSDMITITGKKANINKAVDEIQKIESEMANIVSKEVKIPAKIHNTMIGAGGKVIQSIMNECGGVRIF